MRGVGGGGGGGGKGSFEFKHNFSTKHNVTQIIDYSELIIISLDVHLDKRRKQYKVILACECVHL